MLGVLAMALATPLCGGPIEERPLGVPPDRWPSYLGRCLDVGTPDETLVERARRCVGEEPEDPAPLQILRWEADPQDLPIFLAFASGRHQKTAVEGLLAIGGGEAWAKLLTLAREQPTDHVLEPLAAQPGFGEEDLFIAALQNDSRPAARALGTLGTSTAWAALTSLDSHHEHLMAIAMFYDWSDAGLDRLWMWPDRSVWLSYLPKDHPYRNDLLLDAVHDTNALSTALRQLRTDDIALSFVLLDVALRSPDDDLRQDAAARVARQPHLFPFEDEVSSMADPVRAVGYHSVLARQFDHAPSRDWLWEQLADPLVQWRAAEALVTYETGDTQRALAEWMVAEGPRQSQSRAQPYIRHEEAPQVTPPNVRAPAFSRKRVPTVDHASLQARARHVLDTGDRDHQSWAFATLPWVGDDEDVARMRRRSQLADLGTPAALTLLTEWGADASIWGWSRSAEGWRHMLQSAKHYSDFGGVVRPEAVTASRMWVERVAEMSAIRRGRRSPLNMVDAAEMSVSACREALARGDWKLPRGEQALRPVPKEPVRAGERQTQGAAHPVMARILYVSRDGRTAVSGDFTFGRNILWRRDQEPVALAPVEDLPQPVDDWIDHDRDPRVPHSAATSDDGATVAVLYNGGDLVVFNGADGTLRWRDQADVHELDRGAQRPDVTPGRRFVMDHYGPERLIGQVVVSPSGRAVGAMGIGPAQTDLVQVWRADGRRVAQVRVVAPPSSIGFDRDERWVFRAGETLFALSTRTGKLDRLADDISWAWLEDGNVRWGKKGVDLPPPESIFAKPLPATLENGRIVFWEWP